MSVGLNDLPCRNTVEARVASSASSVSIVADRVASTGYEPRRGMAIHNESTATLRLRYGTVAASATAYTILVPANTLYVMDRPIWQGAIQGIWSAANGAAQVTEFI